MKHPVEPSIPILVLHVLLSAVGASRVTMNNQGTLDNLLIQIDEDILPRMDGGYEMLVETIKTHVTAASEALRTATNGLREVGGGVQLGKVFIKVPASWALEGTPETWQKCAHAGILVRKERVYVSRPYTLQKDGCGLPGAFSRFTDQYFLQAGPSTGREIMREMVKLRYGVFSEEPLDRQLFVFVKDRYEQATCSTDLSWKVRAPDVVDCIRPNSDCAYEVDPSSRHTHSLMFDARTPTSEFFCDDSARPHNSLAFTAHNRLCQGRSIARVVLQHPDFKRLRPKLSENAISFEIVKARNRRIVLVLDTSSSMMKALKKMKLAVSSFLIDVVEDSAEVAIVEYNTEATLRTWMLAMTGTYNRRRLVDVINSFKAEGSTNLGEGLWEGIKVLGGNLKDVSFIQGTIFLLSGGENSENGNYTLGELLSRVYEKQVVINCISFGNGSDPLLADLAARTGGLYKFTSTDSPFTDLVDIFATRLPCESALQKPAKISSGVLRTGNLEIPIGKVDPLVGMNTRVRVTLDKENKQSYVVEDPLGRKHSPYAIIEEVSGTTCLFSIPGKANPGSYFLSQKAQSNAEDRIPRVFAYDIFSYPDPSSNRTIDPIPSVSTYSVDKVEGSTDVRLFMDLSSSDIHDGEVVNVMATVTPLTGKSQAVQVTKKEMRDDGIMPDVIKGDRVFTASLYNYNLPNVGVYRAVGEVRIDGNINKEVITRVVDFPALRVMSVETPLLDKVAPAKVENVTVIILIKVPVWIRVQWTAVGDNGMEGIIRSYRVWIITTSDSTHSIRYTIPPGHKVSHVFGVTDLHEDGSFTVAVQGIDAAYNYGEWSTVVSSNVRFSNDEEKRKLLSMFATPRPSTKAVLRTSNQTSRPLALSLRVLALLVVAADLTIRSPR